jgi:hypothetical protein
MPLNPLDRYRRSVTSQCGEDGVIERLLELLPATPKTCLEVGAGDGVTLSNTNTLWSRQGWQALLIEGLTSGVQMIEKRAAGRPNVTVVGAHIEATGESSIDAIVKRAKFAPHIGVLSLDIDSNDLEVFENLKEVTADIVIIEFNHEIPPEIVYRDLPGDTFFRHSAKAVEAAAKTKGYRVVACTGPNAILVREAAITAEAADAMPALPIEAMFDRAFVRSRRRMNRLVQAKFITEELAVIGKPSTIFTLLKHLIVLGRKLRRALRGKQPGASITPARRENLRRADLWI